MQRALAIPYFLLILIKTSCLGQGSVEYLSGYSSTQAKVITNAEYREFITWVRDSIARRILAEEVSIRFVKAGQQIPNTELEKLNWKVPINCDVLLFSFTRERELMRISYTGCNQTHVKVPVKEKRSTSQFIPIHFAGLPIPVKAITLTMFKRTWLNTTSGTGISTITPFRALVKSKPRPLSAGKEKGRGTKPLRCWMEKIMLQQ